MRPSDVAKKVIYLLEDLGAYEYTRSARGNSIYIKFSNPQLRSLRISDHRGRQKYKYKWNIREDVRTHTSDGTPTRYYYNSNDYRECLQHIRNYANKIKK